MTIKYNKYLHMKTLSFIFGFLFVILNNNVQAQICRASNISKLLEAAEKDKVQKIERMAAKKFHKLLNEYRVKNKLEAIAWDEAAWLTARNHNYWMSTNGTLSHDEKKGTRCYSGTDPGDRYKYATAGKGSAHWSAENILYHYEVEGKNDIDIATKIAAYSFKIWKNSPGHNQNMLGDNHKAHGLAFCINKEGKVYGTDLFVSSIDEQFVPAKKKTKKA